MRHERVAGIDFSAATDAGRRIWIACGRRRGERGGVEIESCFPAEALPGSGRDRETALAAVRAWIASMGEGVVGLDFPFGLPAALVREETWEAFVAGFVDRFPDAEVFRRECVASAGGKELRRATDRQARTPFSPYNLRLYRQTWYGLAAVLGPLVREGRVRVLPMQDCEAGRAAVVEVCPASTLKHCGLYRPYKGRSRALRTARRGIVRALVERGLVVWREEALGRAVVAEAGGDALDAVVGAVAAGAVEEVAEGGAVSRGVEGWVYYAVGGGGDGARL